jgi:hypothetical protein
MRIDGVTTCVGDTYVEHFTEAAPVWAGTLDSLSVVTDTETYLGLYRRLDALLSQGSYRIIVTEAFTNNGAHFNKGAALNVGLASAKPSDWALSFDCDIIPCPMWRDCAEKFAKARCLNGSFRFDAEGNRLDRVPLKPLGYFQLWHYQGEKFSTQFGHAGRYDSKFMNRWGKHRWVDIGAYLVHQGVKAQNWFGPGADPKLMREELNRCKSARELFPKITPPAPTPAPIRCCEKHR